MKKVLTHISVFFLLTAPMLSQAALSGCGDSGSTFVESFQLINSEKCQNKIAIQDLDKNLFCVKFKFSRPTAKIQPGSYRGCMTRIKSILHITAIEASGYE